MKPLRKIEQIQLPLERITLDGAVYAIIIREGLPKNGYNFVSDPQDSLQVGINYYRAGATIHPHVHLPLPRALSDTLEVLHIDSGSCTIDFYDEKHQAFKQLHLESGDTVVLLKGGHGLTMTGDTKIIEIKQGPYLGPQLDKKLI